MTRAVLSAVGLGGPAAYILGGRVVSLLAGVATALLASRVLGADGRGLVVTFSAVQLLLSTGLALGTGSAAYLLASRRDLAPGPLTGGIVSIGLAIAMVATVLAAVAIWTSTVGTLLPGFLPALALLVGPSAGCQYVGAGMVQVAMGMGRTLTSMTALAVAPTLLLVATVAVAIIGPNPTRMIIAYSLAWVAAALLTALMVSARLVPSLSAARRLVRTGSPAALGDLANAFSYRSDVILLGLLAGPTAVGVYALAVQALEPLWLLAGSAAGGLLIELPQMPRSSWKGTVWRSTFRVGIMTALGAVVVLAVMPLLAGIAGPSFAGAPVVALALAPAIVFLAASKTLAVIQLVTGHLGWSTLISSSALAVNVSANLVLIPFFGAIGAGLGSVASYGTSLLLWTGAMNRR